MNYRQQDEIAKFFTDNGLLPVNNIVANGTIQRYGKKGNSWYIAFETAQYGIHCVLAGDWSQHYSVTWKKQKEHMHENATDVEFQEMLRHQREDIGKAKLIEAEKKAKQHNEAAEAVEFEMNIITKSKNQHNPAEHAYTINKQLDTYAHLDKRILHNGQHLFVPLKDIDGKLWTRQLIAEKKIFHKNTTNKTFQFGGKKRGSAHLIGTIDKEHTGIIYVCEGWATGLSIHAATKRPVFCAMDCGNVAHFAPLVEKKYGNVVICADNDLNPNIVAKLEATGLPIAKPDFGDKQKIIKREDGSNTNKYTDYNDLMCLNGIDAVTEQLQGKTKRQRPVLSLKPKELLKPNSTTSNCTTWLAELKASITEKEMLDMKRNDNDWVAFIELYVAKHLFIKNKRRWDLMVNLFKENALVWLGSRAYSYNHITAESHVLASMKEAYSETICTYKEFNDKGDLKTKTTNPYKLFLEFCGERQRPSFEFDPSASYTFNEIDKPINIYQERYRPVVNTAPRTRNTQLLIDFLDYITNYNIADTRYLTVWIRNIVKGLVDKKYKKNKTMLVLKSAERGIGKGLLGVLVSKIITKKYSFVTAKAESLTGKFNSLSANKLFCFVDEGHVRADDIEQLKSLITEEYGTMEGKGKDAVEMEQHMNIIMATNHDIPLKVDHRERRFSIIENLSVFTEQQKKEFFSPIWKAVDDKEAIQGFVNYLCGLNVSEEEANNVRHHPLQNDTLKQYVQTSNPERGAVEEYIKLFKNARHNDCFSVKSVITFTKGILGYAITPNKVASLLKEQGYTQKKLLRLSIKVKVGFDKFKGEDIMEQKTDRSPCYGSESSPMKYPLHFIADRDGNLLADENKNYIFDTTEVQEELGEQYYTEAEIQQIYLAKRRTGEANGTFAEFKADVADDPKLLL